jgi:tetratricopeptide (TPR) repeat protein
MRKPGSLALFLALALPAALGLAAERPGGGDPLAPARRAAAEGRITEALDLLSRLAAGGYRTPELFDLRARLSLVAGDRGGAERDWRRAASLDPSASGPRLALAKLYAERGLWANAIDAYREVLLYRPRQPEAILGLVEAFDRSGRKYGARRLLQTASEVVDDRRIQERWAQVAAASGRPAEAMQALRRIAGKLTGTPRRDVLRKLASLELDQGQTKEALVDLQEALKIETAAGGVTPETYDLLARPTDDLAQQTLAAVGETVRQLDDQALSREEAFGRITADRERLAGVQALLAPVQAPEARRIAQAGRAYAYSLLDEAAVNALTYVDLGLKERREAFRSTRKAAQGELERLARPSSGGT